MPKVLIIKSNLEPYRLPFYSGLDRRLSKEGVSLSVAVPKHRCGSATGKWLHPVKGVELAFGSKKLCWQSASRDARTADLIVVQQSARELINYKLAALKQVSKYRLALWGHGTEFQRSWTTPITVALKTRLFNNVDYWFAYTPGVARIMERAGYPRERICVVFNSVDTQAEQKFHSCITEQQKSAMRAELQIPLDARVICYCGALYKAKRIDFLIEACSRLRRTGLDVHLLIIGEGAEKQRLLQMSVHEKWLHITGEARGERKALLLGISRGIAIPGVVGLAAVDAFAHECPLITTNIDGHGPEIEYLEDGVNGIKTADEIGKYTKGLSVLLTNDAVHDRLREGCHSAASRLTMANMIENFASGVMTALKLPKR